MTAYINIVFINLFQCIRFLGSFPKIIGIIVWPPDCSLLIALYSDMLISAAIRDMALVMFYVSSMILGTHFAMRMAQAVALAKFSEVKAVRASGYFDDCADIVIITIRRVSGAVSIFWI